jgi:hypothetical protein
MALRLSLTRKIGQQRGAWGGSICRWAWIDADLWAWAWAWSDADLWAPACAPESPGADHGNVRLWRARWTRPPWPGASCYADSIFAPIWDPRPHVRQQSPMPSDATAGQPCLLKRHIASRTCRWPSSSCWRLQRFCSWSCQLFLAAACYTRSRRKPISFRR